MPGPLAGIRVIDCATYIAAPAAATIMSDYGASVIKVERPPHGDPYRYLPRVKGMPASDLEYTWLLESRNKRSIALDLSKEPDRNALLDLISKADVFVTNFQPQHVEKFRLRYEDVAPLNPRLIYAWMTGYGEQGEERQKPGYDTTAYFARSGLMSHIHWADAEPGLSPAGFGDHPTALALFGAIMLALWERERTGRGMKVGTSLLANGAWSHSCMIQAALVGAKFAPKPSSTTPANALVHHYRTRDGRRMLIVAIDPSADWSNLCRALGRPDLLDDPRFEDPATRSQHPDLAPLIRQALAGRDYSEWVEVFRDNHVIWSPVPSAEDAPDDPQMNAAGVFATIDGRERGPLRTVTNPIRLDGIPQSEPGYAPAIGEHTVEILRELGYDEGRIAAITGKRDTLRQRCSEAS